MGSLYGAAAPPSGADYNVNALYADPAKPSGNGFGFHIMSVGALVAPPLLMFALMDIMFAAMSGTHFYLACFFAAVCVTFSFLLFYVGQSYASSPSKSRFYMFVGVLVVVATANGVMSGLSIHARFYMPYYSYKNRPVYSDVLATEPAAAVADGGLIGFANNAIVDTIRMGNRMSPRGNRFCVAPILDESQQTQAEFWAVGMDCCSGRVAFYCDDVLDADARTGAVVFDTKSMFAQDPYPEFIKAVKQAAARSQIELPKDPVLVRWVKDPESVTDGLWADGTLHLVAGIGAYALISAVVGTVLHASTSAMK
jgi:hypothetical protein